MRVKTDLTNGETVAKDNVTLIGIANGSFIIGSGFDVDIYPTSEVKGGSFVVVEDDANGSSEKLTELVQKATEKSTDTK